MAMGLLILSGAVITFSSQIDLLKDQNADTDIRGQGRVAIKRLAEEIRNIGAGIPFAAQFVTANGTQLQYRTNAKDGPTSVGTNVSVGDTDIILTADQGFAANQTVVIYDVNTLAAPSPNFELGFNVTGVNVGTDTITLDAGVVNAYNAFNTLVNPYDTVTYNYNAGTGQVNRTINGTVTPFISNVTAVTFVYKDANDNILGDPVPAANLVNIRKIEITMNLQDPNKPTANISFRTDIFIRNTG